MQRRDQIEPKPQNNNDRYCCGKEAMLLCSSTYVLQQTFLFICFTSDYNKHFLHTTKELCITIFGTMTLRYYPVRILPVSNRNTKSTTTRCELCFKLTVRTP